MTAQIIKIPAFLSHPKTRREIMGPDLLPDDTPDGFVLIGKLWCALWGVNLAVTLAAIQIWSVT